MDGSNTSGARGAHAFLAVALLAALAACSGAGQGDNGGSAAEDPASADPQAGTAAAGAGATAAPSDVAPPSTGDAGATASGGPDAASGVIPGATPAPDAPASAAEGGTTGGDGSAIVLSPLTESDLAAVKLPGELACAFAVDGQAPLLLAKGDVASKAAARGVVKVGDYVETVGAPGGFDGMLEGGKFAGQGKTVTVTVTGPASGGGESPAKPASLTYQRADGAERTWAGSWRCGP